MYELQSGSGDKGCDNTCPDGQFSQLSATLSRSAILNNIKNVIDLVFGPWESKGSLADGSQNGILIGKIIFLLYTRVFQRIYSF